MTRPLPARPRGRPRVATGETTVAINVRVPESARDTYQAIATAAGVSISEWARAVLDRAARRARRQS